MTTPPRNTVPAALAACLSFTALLGACNRDEPATFLPESGNWSYVENTVVANSCDANLVPAAPSMFLLDYDEGDSFQVELGEEDLVCEIDGTAFSCGEVTSSSGVPAFDAVITWSVTWEGEFLSETEVEGNEITRVTCAGEDCDLIDTLPCSVDVTFEAMAL